MNHYRHFDIFYFNSINTILILKHSFIHFPMYVKNTVYSKYT